MSAHPDLDGFADGPRTTRIAALELVRAMLESSTLCPSSSPTGLSTR